MKIKKRILKWLVLFLESIIKFIWAILNFGSDSGTGNTASNQAAFEINPGPYLEKLFGLEDDPYEEIKTRVRKAISAAKDHPNKLMPALGKEFLETAAWGDDLKIRAFIDEGFPVNYQDPKSGSTALHRAAANMARDVVRVLIKQDECDFLIRDHKGRLTSECAYVFGHDTALARLLGNKERKQAEAQGIKLTRRPQV